MPYMKPGSPFLYHDTTGDIVGVKDADGGDSLLARTNPAGNLLKPDGSVVIPTATKLRNSIVAVSDSTGQDGFNPGVTQTQVLDNYAWWAAAYSNGTLTIDSSCSVGGWTTADADPYFTERVVTPKIRFVVLGIGFNDMYSAAVGNEAAIDTALRAWITAKAEAVIAYGGTPIIQTMFPAGSTYFAYSIARRKQAFIHNQWRRRYAAANGYPLLDAEMLLADPTSATADQYSAYSQPAGSPHAGKELIRELGARLWAMLKTTIAAPDLYLQSNRYSSNQIFTNPGFTGTAGNLNGANVASVLPDNVWGWGADTNTTFAITPSTDSKLSFSGAPVKSPWITVTTNVATNGVSTPPAQISSSLPGLLFYSAGYNFAAGDIINAVAEIEIVTPNTLIGFQVAMQDNTGTYRDTRPNGQSAFTPALNADNSKNHILTPTIITLPRVSIMLGGALTNAGMWYFIQPLFSGVSGATGNAVWRVRNVRVWKEQ